MIKSCQIIFSVILFTILTGCGTDNTEKNVVGANFISSELIKEVNASTNLSYIKNSFKPNATNAFNIKTVKIKYKTSDENGKSVVASGTLTIPTPTPQYTQYLASVNKSFSISTILENHGTIFTNAEAPTNSIMNLGSATQSMELLMSGYSGFAVIMPDYLGYGDSNSSHHPYILKKSSANVSIDMLKASVRYMTDNDIVFNGQVYVSGYSEGGFVAMAVAEELEKNYASEFQIKGLAAMAGPYDVESLGIIEVNATRTMQYPAFLAYLTQAYANQYSDINLSDVIIYPNHEVFNTLFNGNLSGPAINVALGFGNGTNTFGFKSHTADKLWKTTLINDFANINNNFRVRLSQNNVYNWTPKTKVNLIHCIDDEIIPFSMSQTAYDKFISNGMTSTNLTLSPIPTASLTQQVDAFNPFVHGNCGSTAYGAAVTWFDKIRSGEIK